MIQKLFVHTITVIRFAQTGENPFGEASVASTLPFGSGPSGITNELICRVEEYRDTVEYRPSNEREVNKTIIYLPPQYIMVVGDRVYWGTRHVPNRATGDYMGQVVGTNPAMKGSTTVLDHWEVIIENP